MITSVLDKAHMTIKSIRSTMPYLGKNALGMGCSSFEKSLSSRGYWLLDVRLKGNGDTKTVLTLSARRRVSDEVPVVKVKGVGAATESKT